MANISIGAPYSGAEAETSARPGIFRRFFAALMAAQQRRADREIAAILGRHADIPSYLREEQRAAARRTYPFGEPR